MISSDITVPRWLAVAAALVLAAIALAGCGGSTKTVTQTATATGTPTNTVESPATTTTNETTKSEASVEQIRAKLTQALQLQPRGVDEGTFTLASGKCSVPVILVGKEAVQVYSADKAVVMSPDKNAMVKTVGQGATTSDCVDAVRKALGW